MKRLCGPSERVRSGALSAILRTLARAQLWPTDSHDSRVANHSRSEHANECLDFNTCCLLLLPWVKNQPTDEGAHSAPLIAVFQRALVGGRLGKFSNQRSEVAQSGAAAAAVTSGQRTSRRAGDRSTDRPSGPIARPQIRFRLAFFSPLLAPLGGASFASSSFFPAKVERRRRRSKSRRAKRSEK